MKILILSFYYKPDLCAGSFRTTALVEALCNDDNNELEIVTTLPNRYASFAIDAPKHETTNNQTIHRIELPSHDSGMIDQIQAFYSFYKQAIKITKSNQYDLVFATSSRLFTAFLGARIAKRKNLPLYLDIRDIFVDTIKDVLNKNIVWIVKPLLTIFERYTFKSASHINLVSEGFLDYFKVRYPKPTYTFYTNGIDSQFLKCQKISQVKSSVKTILYAGNIGEGQGLHNIIPRFAKLLEKNYIIKIIGDGGRKKQLVDSCLNLDNVVLMSPVNREELLIEYQKADVLFLHLNDYEAFKKVLPSKIFEYAAIGKPILAGVSGYAAKFIESEIKNAMVFHPSDEKAALAKLSKLSFEHTNRDDFVEKFTRKNIMNKMAESIIRTTESHD